MSDKKTKIVGLPPKIALNDKNAKQGNVSSESSRKKLSDGTLIKNTSCFDDSNTLKWEVEGGAKEDIRMPLGLPVGSYTENVHPNYAMMGIVVDGYPVKGVADGNLIELKKPLQEEDNPNPSILTMEEKSFIYKDDGNYAADAKGFPYDPNYKFYKTGTPVENVGEGFDGPVWAKEKIEFEIKEGKIYSTMESASFSGVYSGTFSLYNIKDKNWNLFGNGGIASPGFTPSPGIVYSPTTIYSAQTSSPLWDWIAYETNSKNYLTNSFNISKYMGEPNQNNISVVVGGFRELTIDDSTFEYTFQLKDYIDKPFVCERIELHISDIEFEILKQFNNNIAGGTIDLDRLFAPVLNVSFAIITMDKIGNQDVLGRFKILSKTNDAPQTSSITVSKIGDSDYYMNQCIAAGEGSLFYTIDRELDPNIIISTVKQTNPDEEWVRQNNCDLVIETQKSLNSDNLQAFSFSLQNKTLATTPINYYEMGKISPPHLRDQNLPGSLFLPSVAFDSSSPQRGSYWGFPSGRKSYSYPRKNFKRLADSEEAIHNNTESLINLSLYSHWTALVDPDPQEEIVQYRHHTVITPPNINILEKSSNILRPDDNLLFAFMFPVPSVIRDFYDRIGSPDASDPWSSLEIKKPLRLTLYGTYVSEGSESSER